MKVKEKSGNVGLILNIQKTKIMASGPITSWEKNGVAMQTVTDFIFLSSKITADGDCSHEIKRCLLLGRKAITYLDSILKSIDITFLTSSVWSKKLWFCQYSFMDVRVGLIIRKAEPRRIDAFELWCWRRLLRVPQTAWRSNPANPTSQFRKSVLNIHWKD